MKIFHRIREKLSWRSDPPRNIGSARAERGQFGEDLAAQYCKKKLGYRIIVRNWRWKRDEIDLICRDGEILVFVEVRSRASNALVGGFQSVGPKKKKILNRVCKNYLKQLQNPPKHFRFDIISIALSKDRCGDIQHYQNVPLFHKHFSAHPKIS